MQQKKEMGILSAREEQSIRDRLAAAKKIRTGKKKTIEFNKDLWTENEEIDPELEVLESEWVTRDLKKYSLRNLGIPKVEVPQIAYEKRNKVKTIEDPLPGLSYNPNAKDYGKLVDEIVEKEEKLIKKDENISKVLAPIFQPVSKGERKRRAREEMTMGFPVEGEQGKTI